MVFSSIADLPAENRGKIRPCIAWAVSREREKNRKEFRRHVNVEDAKMCALTNKSGMDAIHSCDYTTCVIVIQINAPLFSCYMSVSVQVIFYSDHQGCVRAVNKTLIRLLGGSDHRSDQTGIQLKFLPTCNVNSFVRWPRRSQSSICFWQSSYGFTQSSYGFTQSSFSFYTVQF